jgi:glycerol-3-phosphate acyltransferase PlsY
MGGFPLEYIFYALVGSAIILIMHRDNIARLLAGKERRLGDKAAKGPPTPSDRTKRAE